jgi:hypothetical protein
VPSFGASSHHDISRRPPPPTVSWFIKHDSSLPLQAATAGDWGCRAGVRAAGRGAVSVREGRGLRRAATSGNIAACPRAGAGRGQGGLPFNTATSPLMPCTCAPCCCVRINMLVLSSTRTANTAPLARRRRLGHPWGVAVSWPPGARVMLCRGAHAAGKTAGWATRTQKPWPACMDAVHQVFKYN